MALLSFLRTIQISICRACDSFVKIICVLEWSAMIKVWNFFSSPRSDNLLLLLFFVLLFYERVPSICLLEIHMTYFPISLWQLFLSYEYTVISHLKNNIFFSIFSSSFNEWLGTSQPNGSHKFMHWITFENFWICLQTIWL